MSESISVDRLKSKKCTNTRTRRMGGRKRRGNANSTFRKKEISKNVVGNLEAKHESVCGANKKIF